MATRDDELYQAASLYYVQGQTMDAIADQFQVSRSTVSRMLAEARERGIVQISLTRPSHTSSALSATFSRLFHVRCQIVAVKQALSDVARLDRISRVAADYLADTVRDGETLGVAWGTTLSAIAEKLPHRPRQDVTVVQLNGAVSPRTGGLPYVGAILTRVADAFAGGVEQFPVPAFFDYEDTREALWRETAVRRVLEVQHRCTTVVFGVGALGGTLPSQVYAGGYLAPADLAALRADRVVGDICTVMLREDGSWADVPLNARASGPTPRTLARVPRRLCVAAGTFRAAPLLGALRSGAVTDLIVDSELAAAVLARAGANA